MKLSAPTEYLNVFKPTTRGNWDVLTPVALFVLGILGVAFIYSAQFSDTRLAPAEGILGLLRQNWFKQIVYLVLGAAIYTSVSLIDYRFWLSVAHWFYITCLLPLFVVLIPGVGGAAAERWGAQRWIPLGPLGSFQPSETAKIAVLLITASVLIRAKIGTINQSLGTLGKLALAVGAPMLLILLQPDLKSAIVLPPMVFAMLYVSKLSTRFFLVALGAFLLLMGLVTWDSVRYVQFMRANNYSFTHDRGRFEKEGNPPCLSGITSGTVFSLSSTPITTTRPALAGISGSRRSRSAAAGSPARVGRRARRRSSATCRAPWHTTILSSR